MYFKHSRALLRAALPGFAIALAVIGAAILLAVCASRASADVPSIPARATGTLTVSLPASAHAAGRVGRVCHRQSARAAATRYGNWSANPDRIVFLLAGEWFSLSNPMALAVSDVQAYRRNGASLAQWRCENPDGSLDRLEWRAGRKVFARYDGITFTAPRPCIVAAWREHWQNPA